MNQRDIAEALGVSVITVSRALRGLPNVAPETATRIRAKAEELGYRPNPLVQILMKSRRRGTPAERGLALAWVSADETWREAQGYHSHSAYIEGARDAAERAGIRFEAFNPRKHGGEEPLARMLYSRGVPGILRGPGRPDDNPGTLADRFAVVQIGRTALQAGFHRVVTDHFRNMRMCLQEMRRAGYRRIGFFDNADHDMRNEQRWQAAYRLIQAEWETGIQPLLVRNDERDFRPSHLAEYRRSQRLDAVVSGRPWVYSWIHDGGGNLRGLGFACLRRDGQDTVMPGIDVNHRRIGYEAAQMLIDEIQRGHVSAHRDGRTVSLPGTWHAREMGSRRAIK